MSVLFVCGVFQERDVMKFNTQPFCWVKRNRNVAGFQESTPFTPASIPSPRGRGR